MFLIRQRVKRFIQQINIGKAMELEIYGTCYTCKILPIILSITSGSSYLKTGLRKNFLKIFSVSTRSTKINIFSQETRLMRGGKYVVCVVCANIPITFFPQYYGTQSTAARFFIMTNANCTRDR